jgi:hypothetical protein
MPKQLDLPTCLQMFLLATSVKNHHPLGTRRMRSETFQRLSRALASSVKFSNNHSYILYWYKIEDAAFIAFTNLRGSSPKYLLSNYMHNLSMTQLVATISLNRNYTAGNPCSNLHVVFTKVSCPGPLCSGLGQSADAPLAVLPPKTAHGGRGLMRAHSFSMLKWVTPASRLWQWSDGALTHSSSMLRWGTPASRLW